MASTLPMDLPMDSHPKADLTIHSEEETRTSAHDAGLLKVSPYFSKENTGAKQDNETGKFVLSETDKEGLHSSFPTPSSLSKTLDNDISTTTTATTATSHDNIDKPEITAASAWETVQNKGKELYKEVEPKIQPFLDSATEKFNQLKDSEVFEQTQQKVKEVADRLASQAKSVLNKRKSVDMNAEGQGKAKISHINPDEMTINQSMTQFKSLLPYLIPLLVLTLAILSGMGAYKYMHKSDVSGVMHPVTMENKTPFHLHDDDIIHQRASHKHHADNHLSEPSLLDKAKFKANLYEHKVEDLLHDGVDSLKDMTGHATQTLENSFDYVKQKAALLGDKLQDEMSLFGDKAKQTLWNTKNKEAIDSDSTVKRLMNELQSAKESAKQKADDALTLLKDNLITAQEKMKQVPAHEHELPNGHPHHIPTHKHNP